MTELLLYPQTVLLLAPVILRLVWALARPTLLRVDPRVRAVVTFAVIVLPVLAIAVPYVPSLGSRLPVPWRAPIAWGTANFPAPTETLSYLLATAVAALLVLVPVTALVGLLARAAWAGRALTRGLGGEPHPAGFTRVPGRDVAFTVGLLRPRVMLSADVWESPHGSVVLRHEQAHARGRHPLVLVVARAALVLWRWVPGSRTLLADLHDALEECADARACAEHGRLRVARAIVETAAGRAAAPSLGFGDADTAERRMMALANGTRRGAGLVVALAGVVLVPLWLVLL